MSGDAPRVTLSRVANAMGEVSAEGGRIHSARGSSSMRAKASERTERVMGLA